MSIQKDFETALSEADPSLPLCECPRWVEFQALSPEHGDFFAGYMLAMRRAIGSFNFRGLYEHRRRHRGD